MSCCYSIYFVFSYTEKPDEDNFTGIQDKIAEDLKKIILSIVDGEGKVTDVSNDEVCIKLK